MNSKPFSIGIVGSGTAGLISALLIRQAFPNASITVISSSSIGIIGVGEGSTEHWRQFMDICGINLEEMISETAATHKYGIRFENWSTHTPDYFHSVGSIDDIHAFGVYATYAACIEQDKLLTPQFSSVGIIRNKITRSYLHQGTNQFHFDTNLLNEYFTSLAFKRMVRFVDDEVVDISIDSDNGNISSVITKRGDTVSADFWIDASGFSRILMNKISDARWKSYDEFLLCDRAIPFPTESDPSGQIRPYTRARAASAGWIWEVPTQFRRGNGYVYSSKFISDDQAFDEASKMSGYEINSDRVIKFDAGYMPDSWVKNCAAVGLASSFVEPLEATSIGSTIQQVRLLIPNIASFNQDSPAMRKKYNKDFSLMMENILTMIRMHYYSDREDTEFWRAMKNMPVNDGLQEILDLWSERPPCRGDFDSIGMQMFAAPHFAHVAQGQGIINRDAAGIVLDRMSIKEIVEKKLSESRHERHAHELVDHAEALREIGSIDNEWIS